MEKKTSLFENGLIWFGAGVSIAEILTGTYFAPLGMAKGLAAILIGHVIGCILLFLSGVKCIYKMHGGPLAEVRLRRDTLPPANRQWRTLFRYHVHPATSYRHQKQTEH